MDAAVWNFAPGLRVALLGLVIASGPLAWVWLRHRSEHPTRRLQALTWLTLFLTFDLVLFGSFTRLTDSGLGCPDWPGCYGSVSPWGAAAHIDAAEAALPTGPVTTSKAWIEMIHRYLATGVGVLILVMSVVAWATRVPRAEHALSPWWPTATLVWVIMQGAFGALTVTLKLYPAVVTLHLLGGLGLLVLLTIQAEGWGRSHGHSVTAGIPYTSKMRWGLTLLAAVSVLQIALGGWVSTNYAVLACTEFPRCHGVWWPIMDFEDGFTLLRPLGRNAEGLLLAMPALTAIHMVHRMMAIAVLVALLGVAWMLARSGSVGRPWAVFFVGIAVWQTVTGISNVVLGWPILAALGHTGGAALLVVGLTRLWVRAAQSTVQSS